MCLFFTDPATTDIYSLSLHDALPIFGFIGWLDVFATAGSGDYCRRCKATQLQVRKQAAAHRLRTKSNDTLPKLHRRRDRKSTRLNSSHTVISYAVFCLKKKNKKQKKK